MRDRALGTTVRLYFTTHSSTGVAVAPSSAFAASDFAIYKDGSATQKTTTNGITVTSPFDSITGGHLIEIDTSNNTGDTGFFASGSTYRVVLSTAKTVDSINPTGIMVGEFSIELQTADVRKFGGTTVTARDIGASVLLSSGTGTGQISLSSGAVTAGTVSDKTGYSLTAGTGLGNQTANITGNLSGSVGSVTAGVTVTTNNDKTGYSLTPTTGLGNQTANITGTITTATNVTTVNGLGAGVITAASIATGAIDADSLATDAVAEIADGVWDELLSGHAGAGSAGLALSTASSGGVDPSVLADAIWDEALSGHATSGTAGAVLSAVNTKTTNLPADPADQSAVEAAITAATSGLSTLTTADVNAQVLDVLNVDTFSELSSVPTATPTLRQMMQFVFMWFRNKSTQTSTQRRLYADDGTTVVATESTTDDGTTYTKGEGA